MQPSRGTLLRKAILALGLAFLAVAVSQRALDNLSRIDYRNSNFVFFWLAGRMVDAGQNPYDTHQWLSQHDLNHVTWRPNQIFPYPLPLAIPLAPLGVVSLETAYLGWQILSAAVMTFCVWAILRSAGTRESQWLTVPLAFGLLFFGPMYLTLQIGAMGAFTLGALTGSVLALETRRPFLAGALLSLVLLKPPQGLPILLLAGAWLVFARSWRALLGVGVGSFALLLVGMLVDPRWPSVFVSSAGDISTRSLGLHSTVFSVARDLCGSGGNCPWVLGSLAAVTVGLATLAFLWRRRLSLSHLGVFSLILPVAFVSAPYAWSYDQIVYVIPITWVVARLAHSTRGLVLAIAFVALAIVLSLAALVAHAYTGFDLLSSITTLLVLIGVGAALSQPKQPTSTLPDAAGPK